MANTIVVKGHGIRKERIAAGAITPGYLIEVTSTDEVQANSTADARAAATVAVENEVFGEGIDVNYVTGDNVLYGALHAGCEFYGRIAWATAAITRGGFITSAGDGTLKTGTATNGIGVALESVDNSAGSEEVSILVEVL